MPAGTTFHCSIYSTQVTQLMFSAPKLHHQYSDKSFNEVFFNCIKTYINKQITSCLFLQFSVSFNNLRVSISKYFHSPYSQSSPLKPLRHLHSYWCSPRSIHVALCLHGFSFPHSLTTENQSTLYCSKVFNKISRVHIQNRENFFTIA